MSAAHYLDPTMILSSISSTEGETNDPLKDFKRCPVGTAAEV